MWTHYAVQFDGDGRHDARYLQRMRDYREEQKADMLIGSRFLEKEGSAKIVAAIGSERGWTDDERDLLEKNNFTLCSMGCRILRTETAATVAASIILNSMGFLE